MTSGNRGGLPLVKDNNAALKHLSAIADCFLMHDRTIVNGCDDSVAAVVDGSVQLYRRSRGYVPSPVPVAAAVGASEQNSSGSAKEPPVIMGAGGDMKSVFCLLPGNDAFLSQHLGELDSVEGVRYYRESLSNYQRLLNIHPEVIGYDLHPAYRSARIARETAARHVGVQHHHAHLVSCLAENGFPGSAVGIILDGTGYGYDGAMWGFEILTGDAGSYQRRCHLAYFPLPGGEQAVGEHGLTVMAEREQLGLEGQFSSDCAPLHGIIGSLLRECRGVKWMRDLTRGGLATAAAELAEDAGVEVLLEEAAVPVRQAVRGASEMLGLDPLYLANEGKFMAVVEEKLAGPALQHLKKHPLGHEAAIIGRILDGERGAFLETIMGGTRYLEFFEGAPLPRIC